MSLFWFFDFLLGLLGLDLLFHHRLQCFLGDDLQLLVLGNRRRTISRLEAVIAELGMIATFNGVDHRVGRQQVLGSLDAFLSGEGVVCCTDRG